MLIYWDCLEELKRLAENSVDSIVSDPPSWIKFMNKSRDTDRWWRDNWISRMQEIAIECRRVLKPGWHALVWSLPRTSHWTAMALENGGFELRDKVAHLFGSWFPKSHNIWKSVDKIEGNEREGIEKTSPDWSKPRKTANQNFYTWWDDKNSKAEYTKWTSEREGRWTALKPAREDWLLFRKPLDKGCNIAQNCLKWGVGGINIDESRITYEKWWNSASNPMLRKKNWCKTMQTSDISKCFFWNASNKWFEIWDVKWRFPSNLLLSHHEECECLGVKEVKGANSVWKWWKTDKIYEYETESQNIWDKKHKPFWYVNENWKETVPNYNCHPDCPIKMLDDDSGVLKTGWSPNNHKWKYWFWYFEVDESKKLSPNWKWYAGDKWWASRFFKTFLYQAKPSKKEKNAGLEESNMHPTVKSKTLMSYLINMITPKWWIVLDPFMWSWSTGVACKEDWFEFIWIELDKEYFEIATKRIENTVI